MTRRGFQRRLVNEQEKEVDEQQLRPLTPQVLPELGATNEALRWPRSQRRAMQAGRRSTSIEPPG